MPRAVLVVVWIVFIVRWILVVVLAIPLGAATLIALVGAMGLLMPTPDSDLTARYVLTNLALVTIGGAVAFAFAWVMSKVVPRRR